MKIKQALFILLFLTFGHTYAQMQEFRLFKQETANANILCPKEETGGSNPWQFYGGFGLGWNNNEFYVNLLPGVTYRLFPRFRLGGNLQFTYISRKRLSGTTRWYIYGYDLLALYVPVRYMELSADFQQSFVNQNISGNQLSRKVEAFYLGAAFRSGHVAIGMRYDLLYKKGESLYDSPFLPFVRVYF